MADSRDGEIAPLRQAIRRGIREAPGSGRPEQILREHVQPALEEILRARGARSAARNEATLTVPTSAEAAVLDAPLATTGRADAIYNRFVIDGGMGREHSQAGESLGLVIFDGDDTIWETQVLYDRAKQQFARLIKRQGLGFDDLDVVRLLDEVDAEQVRSAGYSRSRFRESMIKTYEELCSRRHSELARSVMGKIRHLGDEVFDQPPSLHSDAVESLSTLGHHYKLALVTKGDKVVQRRRVEQVGLSEFFRKVYIVSEKDAAQYRRVLDEFDETVERTWVVGNSVRSDINPGLQLGLRCILIVRMSWRYEEAKLDAGDVAVVDSLAQAVSVIASRDKVRFLETCGDR